MSSYSFQGRKRVWTPRDEEENRAIFSAMRQETGIKMPPEFKPVYLENAEYAVQKWSLKQLIRVLRLYGSHRCLWDVRDPDNKNRLLRKAALIDITAAMGGHMTMDHVLQKINVLRGTYRYEKRRIKKRMRNGLGASTKLKWFALADAFLRNVPRADKLKKTTEDPVDSDSDLEDSVVFAIDPEVLNPLEEHEPDTQTSIEEEKNYNNSTEPAAEDPIGDHSLYSPTLSRDSKDEYCESSASSLLKRPWTSIESVHFVQLLTEHPILWQNSFSTSTDIEYELDYKSALQQVADSINLPVARISRRIRRFKLSYAEEKLKATSDASYKSNLVWFALADAFIMPSNSLQAPTFVDPNLLPPQTPNSTTESIRIKTEQIAEENTVETEGKSEDVTPVTPLNPIPSVTSPYTLEVAELEGLKCLFGNGNDKPTTDKLIDIRNETCSPTMTTVRSPVNDAKLSEASPSSMPHATIPSFLKLIWNGLEDNLLEGKWSLKHSVKFLRLYGSHRCLWDLNDPCYRSRELRNAAIEDIAAAMGYGLDADYVAKKIKIFRITYMQHRKRMLEAYKDDKMEQEIQLRWFPLADSFLRPHIGLRSIKEHEREMPQFDFQYVYANLNLIDPALLNDIVGKGTQNSIEIGDTTIVEVNAEDEVEEQEES